MHALLRVVDRMIAIDFGRQADRGRAARGHGSPTPCAPSTSDRTWRRHDDRRVPRDHRARRRLRRLPGAVRRSTLHVDEGETVSIIGANGAGKSTLLKAIAGLVQPIAWRAPVSTASRSAGRPPIGACRRRHLTGARGPAHLPVTDGRGEPAGRRAPRRQRAVDEGNACSMRCRCWHRCSSDRPARLSGGEQQTLAIGRALMSNPRLILLDEVSLGLAPVVVRQVYAAIPAIKAGGHDGAAGRAGRQPGAVGRRSRLLPVRGTDLAQWPPRRADQGADHRRLLRPARHRRAAHRRRAVPATDDLGQRRRSRASCWAGCTRCSRPACRSGSA